MKRKDLFLKKEMLASLDANKMSHILGGDEAQKTSDMRTGSCTAFTELFECCPYSSQQYCDVPTDENVQ